MKFLRSNPVNTSYAYFDLKNATIHILDGYGTTNGGPNGFKVNNAGTNAVQTLTLSATAVSGSYKLVYNGQTTGTISTYTAAAAQSALEALSNIGTGNVTVTGSSGSGPFTITFVVNKASEPHNLITSTANSLMSSVPAAVTITITSATTGVYAYAAGISTMTVDTGTTAPVAGDIFTIANLDPNNQDTTEYTVTGSPTTTSFVFTPALVVGVQDNAVISFNPHDLNVKLGDGNFTFTEKKPREYKKNRGKLDAVRNGDEDPLEVKLDFAWIFISSASGEPVTVEEALKKIGGASNWVTAGVDPCEPYCVTMRIDYIPPCENVESEIIDLAEFRYEELQHDTKTGMIACTGKCNLTSPTVTRV